MDFGGVDRRLRHLGVPGEFVRMAPTSMPAIPVWTLNSWQNTLKPGLRADGAILFAECALGRNVEFCSYSWNEGVDMAVPEFAFYERVTDTRCSLFRASVHIAAQGGKGTRIMARKATKKASKKATKKVTKKAASKKKATKKKAGKRGAKKATGDLIISKSRTKAAASINVSGDFYTALDGAVRALIATAEARAESNGRRTLRPQDL
jgi:hypothetical protein